MNPSKSRYSEAISQIVHGKPNLPRCQQPCMFEILSWGEQSQQCLDHRQAQSNVNLIRHPQQDVRIERKPFCEPCEEHLSPGKPRPQRKSIEYAPINNSQSNQDPIIVTDYQPHNEQCCPHTCTIHGKEVKPQLYSYEKVKLKKSHSQDLQLQKTKSTFSTVNIQKAKPSVPKKLDPRYDGDRKIIEQRQKRIKEFKLLSRDLPNSASNTYFGKPVFQAYGRGKTAAQVKTFNVMPHTGENHPTTDQSYKTALIKGRKVSHDCYVPRMPIQECKKKQNGSYKREEVPINLPLQAPDLINHIRFSEEEVRSKNPPVPKQTTYPLVKKKTKHNKQPKQHKRMHKSQTLISGYNDGLKYMNRRQNLLEILEEKKIKNSKLAFKVTECYPLPWNCQQTCQTNPFNAGWSRVRPAGRQYQREGHFSDIFRPGNQQA